MTFFKKLPDVFLIGAGLLLPIALLMQEPSITFRPALRFGCLWGSAVAFFFVLEYIFKRRVQNPFFLLPAIALITLIALGHWATVSIIVFQWGAILGLGLRITWHIWRSDDITLAVILGLTAYTLINTGLNYFKLISLYQSLILHVIFIALIPWKARAWQGVVKSWRASWGVRVLEASDQSVFFVILCGLVLAMGVGWAILTAVPDNGSDTIAAYRGMLIEVTRLGGNIYNPQETSIGLLSLPPLWNQAVSVVLSIGDLHAAKIWNSSVAIASVFVMSKLAGKHFVDGDETSEHTDYIGLAVALFICATPVVSRIILSPFMDIATLFMTASALYIFKNVLFGGQVLTARRSACLGAVIGLWFLTKYTMAYMILPLTLAAFLYFLFWKSLRETLSLLLAGAAAACVVGAFFLFVYMQSGNPTFPYFNSIFKSPFFKFEEMQNPHQGFMDWRLFWVMTLDSPKYSGAGAVMGTLGIGFWFAFLAIIRTIPAFITKIRPSIWPVFTAIIFIIASIILSAIENGDRYIIPFLVMALPILVWAIRTQILIPPLALSVALLMSQFLLVEQWGYGGGGLELNLTPKHAHITSFKEKRPRQYVSDHLSDRFNNQGHILAFGDDGGTQGKVELIGWYDMLAREALYPILKSDNFSEDFKVYIDENNIDAIQYSPGVFTHLESIDKRVFFKTLNQISESWEIIGDSYIWYIKSKTRFNDAIPMTIRTDPDYGYISAFVSAKGTLQVELTVSCTGPVIILDFISDAGWQNIKSEKFMCDGTPHKLRSKLISLQSGAFYYQFREFESLEIHSAIARIR